jgi:hypothetical protein
MSQSRQAQGPRTNWAEVYNATSYERSAVDNPHHHRAPSAPMCNPYTGSERKRAMGGRESTRMESLSTGHYAMMAINRCNTRFSVDTRNGRKTQYRRDKVRGCRRDLCWNWCGAISEQQATLLS